MACESVLPSLSTNAIGTFEGLSLPEPNTDPKKAAITIGAAIDMISARRFEKYRTRSFLINARKAVRVFELVMMVSPSVDDR